MKRWWQTEHGELALLLGATVLVHAALWLRDVPWSDVLTALRPETKVAVPVPREPSDVAPREVYVVIGHDDNPACFGHSAQSCRPIRADRVTQQRCPPVWSVQTVSGWLTGGDMWN